MARGKYSGKEVGGRPPGLPASAKNGRIPTSLLRECRSNPGFYLYAPAAAWLDLMAAAAKADGHTLRLVAAYRDFATQVRLKKEWTAKGKPGYAATPGTSNHGVATAVDVDRHGVGTTGIISCSGTTAFSIAQVS